MPMMLRSQTLNRFRADTTEVKYEMVELAGNKEGHVEIEKLEQFGFTTEDLSRVIYDKFKDEELPDFLDYIGLEKRGGLYRLQEIWSREKYFWFLVLMGAVIF